jgi:dTDP-4-dehydrorhamnose reductase
MNKNKILVIGAGGLVGSRFVDLVPNTLAIKDETDLDITDKQAVETKLSQFEGEAVINFAAITDVKQGEEQRGEIDQSFWQVNVEGARNVARACNKNNLYLIHISTDFVFPGTPQDPGPYPENKQIEYLENDSQPVEKLTWYGQTKLVGENKVRQANESAAIVRIAYPFRAQYSQKLDFARNIIQLYKENKLYPMFVDKTMTLTYIDELVGVLQKMIELKESGTFHVTSTNTTSPFEFANYLLEKLDNIQGIVDRGSMEKFLNKPGAIPRPRIGGLETSWTEKKLGIRLQTWQESVDQLVDKLKEQTK